MSVELGMTPSVRELPDSDPVVSSIRAASKIIVLSHTNPDADAYGSSCGLAWGLKALGCDVSVFNESGFVPRYGVIPGAAEVSAALPSVVDEKTLVIVCDCGALERVGDSFLSFVKGAPHVVNIDHHTSNTKFGHHNMVVEGASSTSELVFDILIEIEKRVGRSDIISSESAACLMAGIIGDTGSFRYSSTAPSTFLAAYHLMLRGARPDRLTQELFATQSLAAVRLQAEAMVGIQLLCGGAFAEITVTQEMLSRLGASILDADSLAERGRDIEGVKVSVLFKQDVDMWRVSLRARQGTVDVSQIAQQFGGGGHKPAAAFRWRKDFASLQSALRSAVQAALSNSDA
jgi:phosphoesterase RecJ-like protein